MKNFRWFVIGLAFLAAMINYLDRAALSYAITPLQLTFNLNNADFGVIAAGFGVGYIITTFVGGILVDKYGAKKIWGLAAISWSIACAFLGAATGFISLFIFRVLLGIFEGPTFPAFNRTIADWLPMQQRAKALASGLVAVPLASVIGAPLISYLIIYVGWRMMFFVLGSLGIIWAILWFKYYHDKPEHSPFVSVNELAIIQQDKHCHSPNHVPGLSEIKTSWKFILLNPCLMINNYAFFVYGYLLFFSLTWLPGYLEQAYGVKLKEIAVFLIAPWLLSAIFLLLGGFLSDWLWQKTQSLRVARSHIIWICQLLSGLCFIPVIVFHSLTIAIIFVSLAIAFGLMPNAIFNALNSDLAKDRAATSLGVMNCSLAVAGVLSPLFTGYLAHLTGNFNAAFILLIGFTLTSALGIIIFQYPDKALANKNETN